MAEIRIIQKSGYPFQDFTDNSGDTWGERPALASQEPVEGFERYAYHYEWKDEPNVVYLAELTPENIVKHSVRLVPGHPADTALISHILDGKYTVWKSTYGTRDDVCIGFNTYNNPPHIVSAQVRWPLHKKYAEAAYQECVGLGIALDRNMRRNDFDIIVPTVRVTAYRCDAGKVDWQGEDIDAPDPVMIERAREIYQRHRQSAAIVETEELIGSEFDVAEVKCFNKTDAILYKGTYYLAVWNRSTSCGNTTAVIARRPKNGVLRVPDNLKGLIIGKGGSKIKELAAAWGLPYIKVQ